MLTHLAPGGKKDKNQVKQINCAIQSLLLLHLSVCPAPTNTQKSSVISPSLLSDLEGLSLSNVSSTMQVSVVWSAHTRIHTYDISCVPRVDHSPLLTLTEEWSAVFEMVKWASLPCGTFLPQTPSIDLSCLLIFMASQDCPTALPVSCISYSLSSSPSPPSALPHPWTPFLRLASESTRSASLPLISPLPVCHLPSLSVRCCVPRVSLLCISDVWPFSAWRLLSLRSVWACCAHLCVFYLVSRSLEREMSRPFFLLLLCLFCVRVKSFGTSLLRDF